MNKLILSQTPQDAANDIGACHYLSAEMMYKPRPLSGEARRLFDAALRARLSALDHHDAVLLLSRSALVVESLAPIIRDYPDLRWFAALMNPKPAGNTNRSEPRQWAWDQPEGWRRYEMTDRWARITFAMQTAAHMRGSGFLLMPAHDAIYGRDLLKQLEAAANYYACDGLPAAISPYTEWQHSPVDGVKIPVEIIDAMNAAFARDSSMRRKIERDIVQAFWGKMNLMPYVLCGDTFNAASKTVWEDDKALDHALRECGYCLRALWIGKPDLYRQSPPVFNRADLRRVIERTLHYSLNIPTTPLGASSLNRPLDTLGSLHRLYSPRFARANALAESLIKDCMTDIRTRIATYGVSWVDWGDYRYVVQVGNPDVEVWGK
jgi:hypothetical protein